MHHKLSELQVRMQYKLLQIPWVLYFGNHHLRQGYIREEKVVNVVKVEDDKSHGLRGLAIVRFCMNQKQIHAKTIGCFPVKNGWTVGM